MAGQSPGTLGAMTRPWDARRLAVPAVLVALAVPVGACGSKVDPKADEPPPRSVVAPPQVKPLRALGRSEGRLQLLARPGVVQAGRGPTGADWVSGFEARTGCRVSVTTAPTSRAVAAGLRTGRFDGAALTGDVTLPLITGGRLAPVNPSLLRAWDGVFDDLRAQAARASGGRVFAVPVDRAVNEVVWRRDRIPGTVRSSGALFDPPQAASLGDRLMMPNDPMTVADAAIWAVKEAARQDRELEVTDPFELDARQFAAARGVLRRQRQYVGAYWNQPKQLEDALRTGEATVGYGPSGVAARLRAERPPVPVEAEAPREGATGFVDAWVVSSRARHPNCMYRWIQHLLTPAVNAEVAEQAGAAPASARACELTKRTRRRCEDLQAGDADHWRDVALWRTPTAVCDDKRGRACASYADWARFWETLVR